MIYTTINLPDEHQNFCSGHIDAAWARQATIAAIEKTMTEVYSFIREEIENGNFYAIIEFDSVEEALNAKIVLEEYNFDVRWPTDDDVTLLISWEDAK